MVLPKQRSLNQILQIFTNELVSIKNNTVKLLVAPDANPKYHLYSSLCHDSCCRRRRLECICVLEKVDYSRLAAARLQHWALCLSLHSFDSPTAEL